MANGRAREIEEVDVCVRIRNREGMTRRECILYGVLEARVSMSVYDVMRVPFFRLGHGEV